MKLITRFASLMLLFIFSHSNGQSIVGYWSGELNVYGNKLPLEIKLKGEKKNWSGTFLSPTQSEVPMNLTDIVFKKKELSFSTEIGGISYSGKLDDDEITGQFKQNGLSFPLNLSRGKIELARPQTPSKPYPYLEEEVTFLNERDGISLSGTFTKPKGDGNYPVVILISGSGAQDRNESMANHQPFMVLAHHLSSNGIAVLRYDDRGTAKSTGDFSKATTYDFASDAESAIDFLKSREDIDFSKIGLLGHSEGGTIAPIVASKRSEIGFIVLMAGTGVSGDKVLLKQQELIFSKSGYNSNDVNTVLEINRGAYDIVHNARTLEAQQEKLTPYFNSMFATYPKSMLGQTQDKETFVQIHTSSLSSSWMRAFILLDPADALQLTNCPVLALNGTKDLQVDAEQNLSAIQHALKQGGNKEFTIKRLEGLNHLFQECKTGLPAEYGQLEQTLSPVFLNTVSNWILSLD